MRNALSNRNTSGFVLLLLSGVAIGLALVLHRASGRSIGRPISFELAEGNLFAWLLLVAIIGIVAILCARLVAYGFILRTRLLALTLPTLIVIASTQPRSCLHEAAFMLLIAGTAIWFLVIAVEMGDVGLLAASAIAAVALPVVGLFVPGIAQKLFVLFGVVASNLAFHGIDRIDPPVRL